MTEMETKGVLLMAFGGPDSPVAIEPFMTNVLGGRPLPPPLVARIKERYRLIGGSSPLLAITRRQAAALARELQQQGLLCQVLIGMRYWRPTIGEAVREMQAVGMKEAVAVSISPHFSRITTGAYREALEQALREENATITFRPAGDWYNNQQFITALAEKMAAARTEFTPVEQENLAVIFSAHSLPASSIQHGEPYLEQVKATVQALIDQTGIVNWTMAFQSKGGGHGEWLGPEVEEVLEQIAAGGGKNVLLVPVGFMADHIETLYDIDIAIRHHADKLGLNFRRAGVMNDSPSFIKALAEVVLREFKQVVE